VDARAAMRINWEYFSQGNSHGVMPSAFGGTMAASILHRVHNRHAYLVFVDEAGFMLEPLLRRTWAPRGCTPIVKISELHGRLSVIGAITISPERRHFSFYFQLSADNANFRGESVVQFIELVRRKVREPITLLWDQILIHRARPVTDYFARHRRLVVEAFPPYAPELNPVDNVWSYVKYNRLPNYTPRNLHELRERITAEFYRLQKRPDLLRSFFKHTGLSLDPIYPDDSEAY
jgi:transposase